MASRPVPIPFAIQSNPAEFREQGDERMINAYASFQGSGKNASITLRMSPGLTAFSTGTSDIALRGSIVSGDFIYAVFETGVYKIDSAGTRTHIGAISGTGTVYMALNANAQIGVVNKLGRYYVIASDIISQINIANIGIGAFNSICWIEGFFVLTQETGKFWNTGLNDAYTINGADFATAEGSPDGLLGGVAHGSELWLFGTETIEIWANTGASPGSPFTRQGGSWINKGCLSFDSIVQCDNTLKWVGNDGIVYRNANYSPRRISTEAVERAIKTAASRETIKGDTYTIDGHIFYIISDANFTQVQDGKEQLWHERKSYTRNRWRLTASINAFGKWLCGATDDGNIYEIDMNSRLEGSDPIISELHSVDSGQAPAEAFVSEIELDLITGRASLSGTIPQTAPIIQVSYSDDGGQFYTKPRFLSLGASGDYTRRVRAHRFGRTGSKFGRRWKVVNADPHIFAMKRFLAYVEGSGP